MTDEQTALCEVISAEEFSALHQRVTDVLEGLHRDVGLNVLGACMCSVIMATCGDQAERAACVSAVMANVFRALGFEVIMGGPDEDEGPRLH